MMVMLYCGRACSRSRGNPCRLRGPVRGACNAEESDEGAGLGEPIAAPAAINSTNANGNPMIRAVRFPDSNRQWLGPVDPVVSAAPGSRC